MSTRVVYSDVDGTLVGPRGSFFSAEDRTPSLEPAAALVALHEADIALVLVSGRTRVQLFEAAALLGADGFIAELGALVCWDLGRSCQRLPADLGDAGAPAEPELVEEMLARYTGSLEFHEPWHLGHEIDVMLRGRVDTDEVEAWLAAAGRPHLRMRDNGLIPPRRPGASTLADAVAGDGPLHVYHLLPEAVTKGAAVRWDLARRGLSAADAVAVGDSASDLAMAAEVGRFFLTANGARQPGLADQVPGITVTHGAMGLGWAEAVRATLAAGRAG